MMAKENSGAGPSINEEQGMRILRKKDVQKKAKPILAPSQKVEECQTEYYTFDQYYLKFEILLVFVQWFWAKPQLSRYMVMVAPQTTN